MARIAIGGFQHETNTFAPTKATYEDFLRADGWPGMSRGAALFETVAGINLPVAGFIGQARAAGHDLVPLLWCSAAPSGRVERDAYERIAQEVLQALDDAGPVDALYLDLHGAMVAEHVEDGEGELLRRIRAAVGDSLPVVCSLDLHANLTRDMVEHTAALVAYRTYPHVDMAETGGRAARLLDHLLATGTAPRHAFRQLSFLVPLTAQSTMIEPAASVYRLARGIEYGPVLSASVTMGFAPADVSDCGPAVLAYATTQAAADGAADHLAVLFAMQEAAFAGEVWEADAAVRHAIERARRAARPVVLADTQDNPGAGGTSDTVGLLRALVAQGAEGAVLAILNDPAAAAAAHAAGEGAELSLALGGRSGVAGDSPFETRVRVEKLGDGRFTATGPFYAGSRMQLGPMALLALPGGGVRVIVASRKQQAADQAMFRHLGVEPAQQKILALKSSVHFRADFQPIAEEVLVVASPGANPIDYRALPYRRLRPGLRLMPLGPGFRPPAAPAGGTAERRFAPVPVAPRG